MSQMKLIIVTLLSLVLFEGVKAEENDDDEIVEYTRIRNSDDTEDSKSCDDSSKNKKRNGINKTKNISKEKQSHDDGSRKKRC
ncbi:hypothetical protein Smp_098020 [Schistosoma mansoni]|uniref:hypothetical protein n=1 Tax=Schistosoma mansoni TaxID=6183 RepID=UPI00019B3508|nr:hypothetical protein Smp_098020 [Schistosoma mansoni]|eukprot:XP_018644033.1 hypothetical protein Smp_098020 [Schistosoma mansoni]